jgi:hypothetical protein
MKRRARILSVSLLVSAAALAACVGALARQTQKSDAKSAPAEAASLKSDAPLAETLSWLDENLTRYGRFTLYQPLYEPGYRVRTSFLGLEARGCVVTYRVKGEILRGGGGGNVIQEPNSDVVRGPSGEVIRTANGDAARSRNNWKPASAGGPNVDVRTLDLAALDPSLVKANTPKKWDGGSVLFGAGRGNVAVSYRDGKGKLLQFDGGEFYVSERERVGPIAEALRRAVALCRK